jgi:hypothetical protein
MARLGLRIAEARFLNRARQRLHDSAVVLRSRTADDLRTRSCDDLQQRMQALGEDTIVKERTIDVHIRAIR